MRVAVVGLGGVGGYIAANFAKAGIDVVGFARGAHKNAIEEHGLKIIEDDSTYTVNLPLNDISKAFDVVLFCTKSYDLLESVAMLGKSITPKTVVMSLANGVDNHLRLQNATNAKVTPGCIYILSHIQKPGVVRKKGKVFAVVFEASPTLATLFSKARLRFKESEDITKELWKKYIFIAAFAMLTSYYDQSIYAVVQNHYEETKQLLEEIATVAKHYGIDLSKEIEKSLQTAQNLPHDATTSMHTDFQNKKQTELESLSGYLVQSAKEFGIELPLIEKIYKELQTK